MAYHVADLSGTAGEDEGDLLAGSAEFVGGRTSASEAELPALNGGGHGSSSAGEESHGGGELHGSGWWRRFCCLEDWW